MKKTMLFLFSFLVFVSVIAQDTILLENRMKFDQLIQYSFMDQMGGLNKKLRNEINNEFKKYDFTGKIYECQYPIDFVIELDSFGVISKCEQIGKFDDQQLNKFSSNVIGIIQQSKWQIRNWVSLKDTNYFISTFHFTIALDCEPSRLFYNISNKERSNKTYVLIVKDDKEDISFEGFENYQVNSRKRKKCRLGGEVKN